MESITIQTNLRREEGREERREEGREKEKRKLLVHVTRKSSR